MTPVHAYFTIQTDVRYLNRKCKLAMTELPCRVRQSNNPKNRNVSSAFTGAVWPTPSPKYATN